MESCVERWDNWNGSGGPKYPHEKVVQFCFRHFAADVRNTLRALDLGCGGGVHTVFLASEGLRVTGTDVSPVAIERTRLRLESAGLTAELKVEPAETLSFPPASFDLVVCIGVLDAAGPENARAMMERLPPLLARGAHGLFLFASDRDFRITGNNPYQLHGYARAEVECLFEARFSCVWIDRYITTYKGETEEQNDWLVTIRN